MKEHAELVRQLVKPGIKILESTCARDQFLNHMVMGIAGEAGELIDSVKKVTIYQSPIDLNNIVEELGDLEFFMEGLRQELGINRETVLRENINKLRKRYGQKYSDTAAQVRADKA